MFQRAEQGGATGVLDRARYTRDKAFVTSLCIQAVNRLFEMSGAHSLFSSEPIQRIHRDANAGARRDGLIMDLAGYQYGRVALGLEP